MSVNLHLCIDVKGYDEARVDAIENGIRQVVAQEGLAGDFGEFQLLHDRSGNEHLLIQTDRRYPVSISRSYIWLPEVEERLKAVVVEANGNPCEVRFISDDVDEGGDMIPYLLRNLENK